MNDKCKLTMFASILAVLIAFLLGGCYRLVLSGLDSIDWNKQIISLDEKTNGKESESIEHNMVPLYDKKGDIVGYVEK